jgi:hypothetical protein
MKNIGNTLVNFFLPAVPGAKKLTSKIIAELKKKSFFKTKDMPSEPPIAPKPSNKKKWLISCSVS